jgi:predicted DNA-binding protein YlxM (UPF0122 family)
LNSLSLLSLSATDQSAVFIQAQTVRASLTQLYTELAKYRKHEARVDVYQHLKNQLELAKKVEQRLTRYVFTWIFVF